MKVNETVQKIPVADWDGFVPEGSRVLGIYSGFVYLAPRHGIAVESMLLMAHRTRRALDEEEEGTP